MGSYLQLVLPASLVKNVLEGLHSTLVSGHMGAAKTLQKVRARFFWSGQRNDVDMWCRKCAICKAPPGRARAPLEISLAQRPLQRVAMDNEFVCRFGVPDSFHTDQGKNFEAKIINEICTLLDIKKARTIAYHPQSDGLVDRFNRTLIGMLSIAVREDEQE